MQVGCFTALALFIRDVLNEPWLQRGAVKWEDVYADDVQLIALKSHFRESHSFLFTCFLDIYSILFKIFLHCHHYEARWRFKEYFLTKKYAQEYQNSEYW